MRTVMIILLIVVTLPLLAQKDISFDGPPAQVTLFGKDVVSTYINERDFAISPDGREIYFTISTPKSTFQTIVSSKKTANGKWTEPEVVSFAGSFSDLEPAFSADGQTLYFSSNRPLSGNQPKDFDIWRVTRTKDGWGKPENLGSPINTDVDEFFPSVARNGNLYFTAFYNNSGVGKEDIYLAAWSGNGYQKPIALDTAVNSTLYEFNAFVSPDEQYILFTSYGRKDDAGGGDLYLSTKDTNGKWKPARNLKELNSRQLDYCPFVSPDGKSLFFTSERHTLPVSLTGTVTYKVIANAFTSVLNGTGNIYWTDFQKILQSVN